MEGNPLRNINTPPHKPQPVKGMTRRGFGTALFASAATLLAAPSIAKNWPDDDAHSEGVQDVTPEDGEKNPVQSEAFLRSVEKYTALQTLDRASVFFTTDDAGIVGPAVPFQDFVVERGTRINKDGVEEPFFYKLTPAKRNEADTDYVVESIPPEWTEYVKGLHAAEYGVSAAELNQQHVTAEFLAALKQDDEPELIAGIEAGSIRTKLDIVQYFITKDFGGSNGENRVEYIQSHVAFSGNLEKAPVVTTALRELLPGLVAVESGYDNEVESKVGAKGSFQFMPGTWQKELKRAAFTDGKELPFAEQVAAAGELFSKMYDRVQYWCYEDENYQGRNYLEDIKAMFPSQEEFEQYFLVPCLLNAYNTGEQGMGEVIVAFAQSKPFFAHMKTGGVNGYDLFHEMTAWAATSELSQLQDYRSEASTYVQKIYAVAPLLTSGSSLHESRVAALD